MQLELARAVLEQVLGADRLIRQLARLAREHEAGAELERERRPEQEAARLRGDHAVDVQRRAHISQTAHRLRERARVGQQRRDVLEADPRLGKSGISRTSARRSDAWVIGLSARESQAP